MLDLDKNLNYLLACSFGPDSMALFDMFLKQGYKFSVAHVNYHLREESDFEEISLRQYCKKFNVNLYVYDNKEILENNVEERAREIRYNFFAKLCSENKLDAVLVAHHLDDLLETYYLQKNRNIIPKVYGLQRNSFIKGQNIIRPLLDYSKSDLIHYCDKNEVPYSIDKTNLEQVYERNKIRLNIINKMSDLEKTKMLEIINSENVKLSREYDAIKKIDYHLITNLKSLDDECLQIALNMLANEKGYNDGISRKLTMSVKKALTSKKANYKIPINKKDNFFVEYGYINLYSSITFEPYVFTIDEPIVIENEYFVFDGSLATHKSILKKSDFPITIRCFKKGDKYKIKDYECEVRRLFIDWKMPISIRDKWPIVINSNGIIIYIPRYNANYFEKEKTIFKIKQSILL